MILHARQDVWLHIKKDTKMMEVVLSGLFKFIYVVYILHMSKNFLPFCNAIQILQDPVFSVKIHHRP